jgi:hypothetical protein
MHLEDIKDEVCPICGSEAIYEQKKLKHSNGHWNESRRFACGAQIDFIPNFMRSELSKLYQCKNDPDYIEMLSKRKKAKKSLQSYIEELDVDDDFKKQITKILSHSL